MTRDGQTRHRRSTRVAAAPHDPGDVRRPAAVHPERRGRLGRLGVVGRAARSSAGLTPAVNMDTGYVQLIDDDTRARVARRGRGCTRRGRVRGGRLRRRRTRRVVRSRRVPRGDGRRHAPRAAPRWSSRRTDSTRSTTTTGWPRTTRFGRTVRPLHRLRARPDVRPLRAHLLARGVRGAARDRGVHRRQALVAVAAASEWDRLALRDRLRPDFHVLTGNDLAIDMVCYGSDYLLGLSAFAPEAFGERDRRWAAGDRSFHELNDLLQYLGVFAFRAAGARVPSRRRACSCPAGTDRRRTRPARRAAAVPTATARCSPTSPNGSRRCCDAHVDAIVQVKRLATIADLRDRLRGARRRRTARRRRHRRLRTAPLAAPFTFTDGSAGARTVGNRFAVLPMEGWDGEPDGAPTRPRPPALAAVRRRAARSSSGAVRPWRSRRDGRANPRQLVIDRPTVDDLAALRAELRRCARRRARQRRRLVDRPAAHALGALVAARRARRSRGSRTTTRCSTRASRAEAAVVLSDDDLDELVETYVARRGARRRRRLRLRRREALPRLPAPRAARRGRPARARTAATFEPHRVPAHASSTASATRAPGPRDRRAAVGVRLRAVRSPTPTASAPRRPSAAAMPPVRVRWRRVGRGRSTSPRRTASSTCAASSASGSCASPPAARTTTRTSSDRRSSRRRTATRRPRTRSSGSARMIAATAELARAHPDLAVVGSGYSYLQQWLPNVAPARRVARAAPTSVGIGRGMLSYPHLPADVLAGRPLQTLAAVPHVQRLHHGAAQRAGLGLLPARRLLQGPPGAPRARGDQEGDPEAHVRR